MELSDHLGNEAEKFLAARERFIDNLTAEVAEAIRTDTLATNIGLLATLKRFQNEHQPFPFVPVLSK